MYTNMYSHCDAYTNKMKKKNNNPQTSKLHKCMFCIYLSNKVIRGKWEFAGLYFFKNSSVLDNREPNAGQKLRRTLSQRCLDLSHHENRTDSHPM